MSLVESTDETYSVLYSVKYDGDLDEDKAAFLIALMDHLYWVFGCFIGACVGRYLPYGMRGIEFSATAFFLVVVINQWPQMLVGTALSKELDHLEIRSVGG